MVGTHPVARDSITERTTRKRAMAVPSLKRLSHSKMRFKRLGTQSSLKILSAAAVSVEEIKVPNKRVTIKGISKPSHQSIYWSIKAIKKADIISDTTANALIDRIFLSNSLYRMVYADSNRRIGKNT